MCSSTHAADFDHEVAIAVDLARITWHQNRCRGVFLDQCRALEPVAGEERGAVVGRRVTEATVAEIHLAPAAERRLQCHSTAPLDLALRWLPHQPRHGRAQADD